MASFLCVQAIQAFPGLADGNNDIDDKNYNKLDVIDGFYLFLMTNEAKEAWYHHRKFLNNRKENSLFETIPDIVQDKSFYVLY